jgi:microcystin-dependent protein
MAQPYVGEIRMFAGNFPPVGWMFCEGQPLPISENETLFQLIGTMYGGDGQSTFELPDLQGRIPIHMGTGPDGITYQMAEAAGTESVTLTTQQIPTHTHPLTVSGQAGSTTNPDGAMPAIGVTIYRPAPAVGRGFDHHPGWKSAAHQLPALPLHQLHHLFVRHLPVPDLSRRPHSG